jgi:Glycosyl hydrolase family 1
MKFSTPKLFLLIAMLGVVVGLAVGITLLVVKSKAAEVYSFPETFTFGAASAAYQIEGAWNEDGKSASIWDTLTHKDPGFVVDRSNGDVAANSYHMYSKDIEALEDIGVGQVTRLSLSA